MPSSAFRTMIRSARDNGVRRYLYTALILVGVCLRTWQFLADTSLNVDEVALAYDIVRTSTLGLLLHPLPEQIAPKGFLLASKAAVGLFGPTDTALRAVAFVSSIASVLAFWRLATRLSGWAGPLALALFSMAPPLILFGAEVKQYSCDVLATVLLLLITARLADDANTPSRRRLAFALTGAATVWLSHAAILVIASHVAVLLWRSRGRPHALAHAMPILAAWMIAAAVAAGVAFMSVNTEMEPYLKQYWAAGFLPGPRSFMTALQ